MQENPWFPGVEGFAGEKSSGFAASGQTRLGSAGDFLRQERARDFGGFSELGFSAGQHVVEGHLFCTFRDT